MSNKAVAIKGIGSRLVPERYKIPEPTPIPLFSFDEVILTEGSKASVGANPKTHFENLSVVGASIIGSEHIGTVTDPGGLGYQDAYLIEKEEDFIFASVADGSSSREHSGVGSKVLTQIAYCCASVMFEKSKQFDLEIFENEFTKRIEGFINSTCNKEELKSLIAEDYLLSTILCAFITKEKTYIFGCGDGLWSINGLAKTRHYVNNMPPYYAYKFYPEDKFEDKSHFNLKVYEELETIKVGSLIIASDGLEALVLKDKELFENLESHSKYILNPVNIKRTLSKLNQRTLGATYRVENNSHIIEPKIESNPVFGDDTTLVLIKYYEEPVVKPTETTKTVVNATEMTRTVVSTGAEYRNPYGWIEDYYGYNSTSAKTQVNNSPKTQVNTSSGKWYPGNKGKNKSRTEEVVKGSSPREFNNFYSKEINKIISSLSNTFLNFKWPGTN